MRLQVLTRREVGDLHCSYATATLPPKYCLYMAQTGETWSLVLLYARAEMGYYLPIHSCCRVLQYLLSAHCWSGGTDSIPRYVVVHEENEQEAVVT